MSDAPYQVLFICTGNSARSIMAEALLAHLGGGRFVAHSAGSHPTGQVHPLALATLAELGVPQQGLRSKSWDEFAGPQAPVLDFTFTVCDRAAGETCPLWPGQPMTAHWGVEDPAAPDDDAQRQRRRFLEVALVLKRRIELLLALPIASLAPLSLQHEIRAIGQH
ncbi:arsenate reductase ArsC [Ideonella sp. 4Y11]|uniref:Arsenate reductase ArsC n=1 Tax=Ideonella aquatica TaxID=2824119 RepID=A0A940YGV1_9BURK|nr:arsenate reductase ArsC [Ideonella aquatica]MBQ0957921.1 arsenate reductase ArsC [Ideonella aquatica]